MPNLSKEIAYAFSAAQVEEITGLTLAMVNYLVRKGYLVPSYQRDGGRGKVRYFSFRDLVIARIIQKLALSGLELTRLKKGIQMLQETHFWLEKGRDRTLSLLATDGVSLFVPDENGSLHDLARRGQMAFTFLLDVNAAREEVRANLSPKQREHFSMRNRPLRASTIGNAPPRKASVKA